MPRSISESSTLDSAIDMPDADIIVRSADAVDFRVHKTVLSVFSSVFGDMLSMPQPRTLRSLSKSLPVADIPEDGPVVEVFVRCVPSSDPSWSPENIAWRLSTTVEALLTSFSILDYVIDFRYPPCL